MTPNFDFLTPNGTKIIQAREGYHFTSDAISLGNFVCCKPGMRVLDLGCGGGVLSLLVASNCNPSYILAVDIDPCAVSLAQENIALNNFNFITALHADARTLHKAKNQDGMLLANTFDIIVCNPPYFSSGKKSVNSARATARHDDSLTLDELCTCAMKLLKYGGEIFMCYPSKYLGKAIGTLEKHGFRIRELELLSNNKGVYLALIRAKISNGHNTRVTIAKS